MLLNAVHRVRGPTDAVTIVRKADLRSQEVTGLGRPAQSASTGSLRPHRESIFSGHETGWRDDMHLREDGWAMFRDAALPDALEAREFDLGDARDADGFG